ncbi:MAG: tRNA (N6-isopentenyl adenosine(37)-C2)-methylthiotransferase MiaB [Thermodesulfobacteriota bacterium]
MQAKQHAHIETFGCQMNERDSEIMAQTLGADYQLGGGIEEADLVIVNTCSIREKAEQKAFSLLGRLRRMKKERPELLIVVAGCVAQQEGSGLRHRMPHVDVVVGPQQIYQLPQLLEKARLRKTSIATDLRADFRIPRFLPDLRSGSTFKRFVTIMQGCNNFCSYCVVPYTRGREISRNEEDILAEIRHLASHGIREVTLLGQNVNSFGRDRAGSPSFAALLRRVAAIEGIDRIRFTTSHPKDLSTELMRCFADLPKLCPHFHLPVQSGSNRILSLMNRGYAIEAYLDKVEELRGFRPDIALTTDIIVGFPGESEDDFLQTMAVLERVRYHGAFSFKYSDRPKARSAGFADKVAEEEKGRRLEILQKRQEEISLERLREWLGRELTVMVEGESRTAGGQCSGRTERNQIVNFTGDTTPLLPGQLVRVRIEEVCLHSLRGSLVAGIEIP